MAATPPLSGTATPSGKRPFGWLRIAAACVLALLLLCAAALLGIHAWMVRSIRSSLPQIDGTLSIAGLHAPVTIRRDEHGVPHIRAASVEDLVLAQGYVTAQDRLWQMEALRRHASGSLAEILGTSLIEHDRTERTLQLRSAADRAIVALPADQLHWLTLYTQGVNDSIEAQQAHLPIEFRLLRFTPAPWTTRDSLLIGLAMFQDLTNVFPIKLNREAIAAKLTPEQLADLYPVGSWRDHPPMQSPVDLTQPVDEIPDIPLDESQTALLSPEHIGDLLHGGALLPACDTCRAGSNDWAVSGDHTATGKPLLSNDMHLNHLVPNTWYEADLAAGGFHVAGVTLPGMPFVIVGHNDHVAWGFTNLGGDVQDITIEHTRGEGSSEEYQAADGSWKPVEHQQEIIHVKGGKDIALDVPIIHHGAMPTPVISGLYPHEKRILSLSWTLYDPANVGSPFFTINSAADGASLVSAFSIFGGPAQNMVYADDQGHIGYHSVGRIPLRGDAAHPSPLLAVPTEPAAANEWSGYIPYDQLPQVADPPGGIVATANSRVTPDGYPYPITLNWSSPYRNQRIWKVLSSKPKLVPADMLALETDVVSEVDRVLAHRFAYAIDHAKLTGKQQRLHQAADLLRKWNGSVDADTAAPAIVVAARAQLWNLLLEPRLGGDLTKLYRWDEKDYAQEQLVLHQAARWLPPNYSNWNDLLAAAVEKGLEVEHAPSNLANWRYGKTYPLDIEHPVLGASPILKRLIGLPVGTGSAPQSGDGTTVKQVGHSFGPSERFTANLADLDQSTLNIVIGQSGNPASPWFMDQFNAWYTNKTFLFPYTDAAINSSVTHTLTLTPQ